MQLHHIAITVKNLSASIFFYEEHFGFKEKMRFRRDDMGATGVMLQGANIIIELWQFDVLKEGSKDDLSFTGIRHIAFTHDDPELLRNEYIEKGLHCGAFMIGASRGHYFFLFDPDGNQIEVYKPFKN